MFCRDSKLLVMEKMRRQFCIGPYGDSLYAYCSEVQRPITFVFTIVNSIQTGKCLGQNSAQKIV